ncbi:MAG TPA: TRAP transporter substrate-binding protein [Thermodesulfobacteriota bacterium]|nr:TRAP transporter substrate-binding protein [Thermodesulfobacteriota bacterium]
MKRSTWVKCFGVALVVFLFVLPLSKVGAQQKTISLNYSNLLPATHKISLVAQEWCNEIEKRTNGGVKITMFHGGTLTPATQAYDGVVKGVSDVAVSVFSYHRGRFPLTEFSDLPIGVKSCVTAAKLFTEYYVKFKPKEMDDVKVMYLHGNPPSVVHTVKKVVSKLDDLKGLKMRVTPLGTPIAKALGAAPVAMPMGDAYDALSKNVVDGGFFPYEALEGWKLGEVVKYTTESWPVGFTSAWYVIMNKAKWDSIPPEMQKAIEQVNAEWIEKTGKTWDGIDEAGKAFSLKQGNKVVTLSKEEGDNWVKAVQPVLADYVKMTKEKGLPGDEVLKFALDYLKKNQK